MDSIYFATMLLGVGWLAVWSILPRPWQGGGFWPFDMRQDVAGAPTQPDAGPPRQGGPAGDASPASAPPAAQHTPPMPSWRQRRDQQPRR
jgi:hypothetical protein